MEGKNTDPLDEKTGLTRQQRVERARRAGASAHTISNYVRRIVKGAPELTPADVEALRVIVGAAGHAEVYASGLKAGARLAREAVDRAFAEVVGA